MLLRVKRILAMALVLSPFSTTFSNFKFKLAADFNVVTAYL